MFLELKNYDLNFKENGSLELTIDYVAFIEAEFEGPRFDIFDSFDKQLDRKIRVLNQKIDAAAEELDGLKVSYDQKFIDEALKKRDEWGATYRSGEEVEKAETDLTEAQKLFLNGDAAAGIVGWNEAHSNFVWNQQRKEHAAKVDKMSMHASILEAMMEGGKLKYLDVPNKVLDGWSRFKYFISGGFDGSLKDPTPSWLRGPVELLSDAQRARFENEKINHLLAAQQLTGDVDPSSAKGFISIETALYVDWMKKQGTKSWLENLKTPNSSKIKKGDFKKGMDSVDAYLSELKDTAADSMNESNDKTEARLTEAMRLLYEQNAKATTSPDTTRINYFFIGDLFATVTGDHKNFEHIKKALKESKIMIVLGPYQDFRARDMNYGIKSIGDIPIALETYIEWYNSKAVNEGKTKWALKDFIRDVIYELVLPNLGVKCNPANPLNIYEFEQAILALPDLQKTHAAGKQFGGTVPRLPYSAKSSRVRPDLKDIRIQNMNKKSKKIKYFDLMGKDVRGVAQVKDMTNYLFIYISNHGVDHMAGNYKTDHENGIYHFILGNNVGLIRGVKFKKAKMKYAAELQTERSMEANSDSTVQLWRKFDVQMSLIGNTLLKPGMLIYIQPKMAGLGDPTNPSSMSRLLGLGGYYLLTRVDNTIDNSGWKTDVVAQWQGDPKGSKKKVHSSSPNHMRNN